MGIRGRSDTGITPRRVSGKSVERKRGKRKVVKEKKYSDQRKPVQERGGVVKHQRTTPRVEGKCGRYRKSR